MDELLGFVPRRSKRATIKKKPEKFEPSVQDKIRARRAAAAKGKNDYKWPLFTLYSLSVWNDAKD